MDGIFQVDPHSLLWAFFAFLPPRQGLETRSMWLLGTVVGLLFLAYVIGWFLQKQPETTVNPAVIKTFNLRVRAWWMMSVILVAGFMLGQTATVILFGLVSFWALREFITMTPTRRGDHRALFWVFFAFTPAQYVLVGMGEGFYGAYSVLIPVYATLFVPARIAISGDSKRFLERSAKIQSAQLICVYALSHAPALLYLQLNTFENGAWVVWDARRNAGLLFYFVLLLQMNDVLQYGWGKLLGRRVIAPAINASRTWEGFIGGVLSTTVLGASLSWVTPFTIWGAACMSAAVATMGFAGSMTMSAIKRDRGVRDYGTLVQGHAGVLDRIDSVCFAAPVFFHLTKLFMT